ncbi:hypothetical protein BC835DRAFT_568718 [Cytidiella melzeri]|nr:hypothetical protein BC835DRAFT_568718 [Cytidiella melzeri]
MLSLRLRESSSSPNEALRRQIIAGNSGGRRAVSLESDFDEEKLRSTAIAGFGCNGCAWVRNEVEGRFKRLDLCWYPVRHGRPKHCRRKVRRAETTAEEERCGNDQHEQFFKRLTEYHPGYLPLTLPSLVQRHRPQEKTIRKTLARRALRLLIDTLKNVNEFADG